MESFFHFQSFFTIIFLNFALNRNQQPQPTSTMQENNFMLPAEWEEQSGIQLTWPHKKTDWQPHLAEIEDTFLKLAEAIASRERLIIATPHPKELRKTLVAKIPAACQHNISVYCCPSNDTWARDHGAITTVKQTPNSPNQNCRLFDFKFNGWGEKFASTKDNAITRTLYKQGVFNGELIDCEDFVLEGGSIESDGKGTIMTTSSCLLAPHRNQPMTKEDIERQLLHRLYAKRVIWIDHGHLIGDDTDGHIDTIARYAPNDTIIYVGCDDKSDPQYGDFQGLEKQLKGLRTLSGKPYNLVKLPMPQPIFDQRERLPATYANFLVINGAVIVPTYHQPDADSQALSLVGNVFPDREIIGIDANTIIRQHGSIHCLTMQFPNGCIR